MSSRRKAFASDAECLTSGCTAIPEVIEEQPKASLIVFHTPSVANQSRTGKSKNQRIRLASMTRTNCVFSSHSKRGTQGPLPDTKHDQRKLKTTTTARDSATSNGLQTHSRTLRTQ